MSSADVNAEQQAAIEHVSGPLRIMAGAGTGKTFTLTERVVHLIASGHAAPSEILALTFTNKAVDELRSRIDAAVGALTTGSERVDIDTYHAFGGRIVNEFGARFGLPADPVVLTRAESWIILWRAIDEIGFEFIDLGEVRGTFGTSPLAAILDLGSRLSDELRTVEELKVWLEQADDSENHQKLRDYARGLEVYQRRKLELGAIDYGDQIALACKLLDQPDVAATMGSRYTFVLVDEFQDTNYAQSVMVQRLCGEAHRNVCIVGDPNQAIYSFRGAAPDNLDRFAETIFPDTVTLPLSYNYRSTQQILDLANAIWGETPGLFRGNLRSGKGSTGPKPLLVEADHADDELLFIARTIEEVVESGEREYGDIAVITRKRVGMRAMFETLQAHGIPAEMIGGESLYDVPEVREIISWLRIIGNHRHDPAFAYVFLSERWGMDERDLYALSRERQHGESLLDTAQRVVAEGKAPEPLIECIAALAHLTQRSYAGLEPLMEAILALRQGASDPVEAANIDRFAAIVRDFATSRLGAPDLRDLIAYLDLMLIAGPEDEAATDDVPATGGKVTVITAHSAKGLQWPVVFVARATYNEFFNQGKKNTPLLPWDLLHPEPGRPESNDFPGDAKGQKAFAKAIDTFLREKAREEEFRILYVALTRAEQRLFVSWSRLPEFYGKERRIHPALETIGELCHRIDAPRAELIPAPVSVRSIAPHLVSTIQPLLDQSAARSEAQAAQLLNQAAAETGVSAHVLADAYHEYVATSRQLDEHLQELALAEARALEQNAPALEEQVVSFTQLDAWDACPHQYYLRYVRHLPGAPRRWATGYGSALHRVLAGEATRRGIGLHSSVEELRSAIQRDPQVQNRSAVDESERPASEDPIDVYLRSPDATAEPLLIEEPFTLRLGSVTITGVIDRVHRLRDGSTEVVDYKTSMALTDPAEVRQGLQLPIYLIACQEIFRDIKPVPERAVLFNLRHNQRIAHTWSKTELDNVRKRVEATAAEMLAVAPGNHHASPLACSRCEYQQVCDFSVARDGMRVEGRRP